jgi:hypothetical protein
MVSSIYNSNSILYKSGSRKGKSLTKLKLEETQIIIHNNKQTKHYKEINHLITKSGDVLNLWELDFLQSISKQKYLSKKQVDTLNKIKKEYVSKKNGKSKY